MRCSEDSQRFEQFAQTKLADFLLNEKDIQVNNYEDDYINFNLIYLILFIFLFLSL
jgi:hypothetical protein